MVAAVLATVGIAAGVTLLVLAGVAYVDRVDDFQRVPVGTGGTFVLGGVGGHSVYLEADGVAGRDRPRLAVEIRDGREGRVPVEPYGSKVTYDVSGHEGVALGSFSVDRPGTYTIRSSESTTGTLAVGRGLGRSLVRNILLGAGIIAVTVVVAVALATVTLLARARAARTG